MFVCRVFGNLKRCSTVKSYFGKQCTEMIQIDIVNSVATNIASILFYSAFQPGHKPPSEKNNKYTSDTEKWSIFKFLTRKHKATIHFFTKNPPWETLSTCVFPHPCEISYEVCEEMQRIIHCYSINLVQFRLHMKATSTKILFHIKTNWIIC